MSDVAAAIREAETRIVCQLYDWHTKRYMEMCDLALTAGNGIAGAHASAHSAAMDYCRALIEELKEGSEAPRITATPSKERSELDALLVLMREKVAAMTPEEREAMYQAQRKSWVRGNLGIDKGPDARRTVTGGGENPRADRMLADLREPSDELLNSLANSETMKLVAKAFLCAAAEWLRENVK